MTSDREPLVLQYWYLCARAGRKFRRPGVDRADLEQIAAIGLIKACDRYDAALQTPFEAFAWLFIVGELMHYVRDHERIVRAPRRVRELERRCLAMHDRLTSELGREPTREEMAQGLGVTLQQVDEVARYREQAVSESIDTLQPHQLRRCSYTLEDRDDRIVVEAALALLNDTERKIILALYASGYSQIELAERLGYSRRHISRLHRAALKKMQPLWVSKTA
jgi:RNA polymerase sigma-B factor